LVISDEDNWNEYKMLDYYKREIVTQRLLLEMPKLKTYHKQQQNNWHRLEKLFGLSGAKPLIDLQPDVFPAVFLAKVDNFQVMYDKYAAFGVETGRYYHENALFLPVNHSLGAEQMDYMYAVYHGYLNLCSEYRREM